MKKKPILEIQYKYPYEGWLIYDYTKVEEWAKTQYERCERENPGAEVRIVKK